MLGERFREVRELRNLTQNDVANFLKIKRQTYSSYERNKSLPDANTLGLLATYFSVTTDYLLDRESVDPSTHEILPTYGVLLTEQDKNEVQIQAEHIKSALLGFVGMIYDGSIRNDEILTKMVLALDEGLLLTKQEMKTKYHTQKTKKMPLRNEI